MIDKSKKRLEKFRKQPLEKQKIIFGKFDNKFKQVLEVKKKLEKNLIKRKQQLKEILDKNLMKQKQKLKNQEKTNYKAESVSQRVKPLTFTGRLLWPKYKRQFKSEAEINNLNNKKNDSLTKSYKKRKQKQRDY